MHYEVNKMTKIYATFSEFVELSATMPRPSQAYLESTGREASREKSNSREEDFFGDAYTFDIMHKRCYDGYNAKAVSDKRHDLSDLVDYERPTDELSYVGDALDVPTYISGDMRCWWRDSADKANTPKRIHITYTLSNGCTTSNTSILNHGGAISVIADAINNIGANVKITANIVARETMHKNLLMAILLKDYSEDVDVPRIGACTHPSFFRRIGLSWFERFHMHINDERCKMKNSHYGFIVLEQEKRPNIVSDEEFAEWLRIDEDEIVIDLPNAFNSVFRDTKTTAKWVEEVIAQIQTQSQTSKYIKVN